LGAYVKYRRNFLWFLVFEMVLFVVVFLLYEADFAPLWYAFELSGVCVVLYAFWDFAVFVRKYNDLHRYLSQSELFDVAFSEHRDVLETQYQQLILQLLKNKQTVGDIQVRKMMDMRDYYAMWAHQIKTPIAAANLLLQVAEANDTNKHLKKEMFQIEFYVDAVMNYLRLEDLSSDYNFQSCDVEKVVRKAVKKFASQFIGKHIGVQLQIEPTQVYSDVKWLGFILEQLISNAVKYTNEGGTVTIGTEQIHTHTYLYIEDTGIGIRAEDLPRIMERGYTGYNGRTHRESSGIGLYLVKKASDKLGLEVTIQSEEQKGTKVRIDLTQNHTFHG